MIQLWPLIQWLLAGGMGLSIGSEVTGMATGGEETLWSLLGITASPKQKKKLAGIREQVVKEKVAGRDIDDMIAAIKGGGRKVAGSGGRDAADLSMLSQALGAGYLPSELVPEDIGGRLMDRVRKSELEHLRRAVEAPPPLRIKTPEEVLGIQPPPPAPARPIGPPQGGVQGMLPPARQAMVPTGPPSGRPLPPMR